MIKGYYDSMTDRLRHLTRKKTTELFTIKFYLWET